MPRAAYQRLLQNFRSQDSLLSGTERLDETTLVLSGAGINITYEVGIVAALLKHMTVRRIIGCSAGALIGLAVAVGYDMTQFKDDVIKRVGNIKMSRESMTDILWNMWKYSTIFRKDVRVTVMKLILKKAGSSDIFFRDLKIDLQIVATDITNCRRKIFSKASTPDVSVVSAVFASSAIPGLFPVVKIGSDYYFDGSPTGDLPYNVIAEEEDDAIAVYISAPRPQLPNQDQPISFKRQISSVAYLSLSAFTQLDKMPESWRDKTIIFEVTDGKGVFSELTREHLRNSFRAGLHYTQAWLRDHFAKRQEAKQFQHSAIESLQQLHALEAPD